MAMKSLADRCMGNKKGLIGEDKPLESGAGEQIRTVVTSLEGWGSTIELRPLFCTNERIK